MDFKGIFIDPDEYNLIEKDVGEGGFSKIQKVKNKNDDNEYVAKIISQGVNDEKIQINFMREATILFNANHPAFVKLIGVSFRSLSDSDLYQPTIIMEYMPNGSLKEILDKEKNSIADAKWTPTKKYISLLGISSAMRFLHAHKIIHRDLKPGNVLIDENYYPKLCDFGLSKYDPDTFSDVTDLLNQTRDIGTPISMAPEMLNKEKYGPSLDVYSFGLLAFEIITNTQPFSEYEHSDPFVLYGKVLQGVRPKFVSDVPENMKILIEKCWDNDPNVRPTFDEIYKQLSTDLSHSPEDLDTGEIKAYLEMLESSQNNFIMVSEKSFDIIKKNFQKVSDFLFFACESNNIDLFKFLVSNQKIDFNQKIISNFICILFFFFFFSFLIMFIFYLFLKILKF